MAPLAYRPSLTVNAHADEDAYFLDLCSRVHQRERNFPCSLPLTETPKTKMQSLLEVPPGTRLTEKELHLRLWTKMTDF